VFFSMTFYRFRVKTEVSFTAEDPWNQNRRATFTLDDYVLGPRGMTPGPNVKPAVDYLRGIRSSLDSAERMLPESLSELWRTKRVPAEALPALLKELEPTLKESDFKLVLHNKAMHIMLALAWMLVAFSCTAPFLNLYTFEFEPSSYSLPIALGVAAISLPYMYFVFYRGRRRRTRQMKSALARLNSIEVKPEMKRDPLLKFDIDRHDGAIRLPNGFVVNANLTRDAFEASAVYDAARRLDSGGMPWTQYRFPGGEIDGKDVSVTLAFSGQTLIFVNLTADLYPPGPKSWDTYSDQTEAATKDFHDRLLAYLFADPPTAGPFHPDPLSEDTSVFNRPVKFQLPWGSAESTHDPRGDETYITVSYGNRYAEAARAFNDRAPIAGQSASALSKLVQSVASDPRFASGLEKAKQELMLGNKIDAIRLARQATGLGLKEAQELIASWEKKP